MSVAKSGVFSMRMDNSTRSRLQRANRLLNPHTPAVTTRGRVQITSRLPRDVLRLHTCRFSDR